MKTFRSFLIFSVFTIICQTGFSQAKTEKFKVAGSCGMCKNKIEKAAKQAGASYAVWDVELKELTVKYKTSSNAAKVQEAIANAGYDTPGYKATDDAYNKLHGCCKYDRAAETVSCCKQGAADKNCCKDGKSSKEDCCKDGKCTKEGACCNEGKENCCKPLKS